MLVFLASAANKSSNSRNSCVLQSLPAISWKGIMSFSRLVSILLMLPAIFLRNACSLSGPRGASLVTDAKEEFWLEM